jgi:hypothetical protein
VGSYLQSIGTRGRQQSDERVQSAGMESDESAPGDESVGRNRRCAHGGTGFRGGHSSRILNKNNANPSEANKSSRKKFSRLLIFDLKRGLNTVIIYDKIEIFCGESFHFK